MTLEGGITTAGAGTGGGCGRGRGRGGGGSDISRIPAQRAAVAVRRLVVPQHAGVCRHCLHWTGWHLPDSMQTTHSLKRFPSIGCPQTGTGVPLQRGG